ncbi:unnamed protein product [Moneuplotes crassus]|uniref:Uncharacterized protein n=1 Tax=Euplotes crassus TaxID=5936 RepID=A0AAD2D8H2_EUPCR|nr:unnamed protein product [Moneuplotes crassus]
MAPIGVLGINSSVYITVSSTKSHSLSLPYPSFFISCALAYLSSINLLIFGSWLCKILVIMRNFHTSSGHTGKAGCTHSCSSDFGSVLHFDTSPLLVFESWRHHSEWELLHFHVCLEGFRKIFIVDEINSIFIGSLIGYSLS